MPTSCKDLRAALAECLATSDCVLANNKPGDCLRPPLSATLSPKCQQIKTGFAQCKRNMIDMRKRFRGTKPVGGIGAGPGAGEDDGIDGDTTFASASSSASGGGRGARLEGKGMLYAGRTVESVLQEERDAAVSGSGTSAKSSGDRSGYEAKK